MEVAAKSSENVPDTELSEFISEGIYFVEDDKLKKVVKGEIVEAEVKELLERNYENMFLL